MAVVNGKRQGEFSCLCSVSGHSHRNVQRFLLSVLALIVVSTCPEPRAGEPCSNIYIIYVWKCLCSLLGAFIPLHRVLLLLPAISGIMQLLRNIPKLIKPRQTSCYIIHHWRRMISTSQAALHCFVQGLQQNSIKQNTLEIWFLTKRIC